MTEQLNDFLLDLLDQMKNLEPCKKLEELDKLIDFCNQLTNWSDFTEAEFVIENLYVKMFNCKVFFYCNKIVVM